MLRVQYQLCAVRWWRKVIRLELYKQKAHQQGLNYIVVAKDGYYLKNLKKRTVTEIVTFITTEKL
ncbi:MAG: hypothetical protein HQM11_18335 [SAR324 cluster bacterium]|nr:hypothetical protein [SAR324 cluster bacterium]